MRGGGGSSSCLINLFVIINIHEMVSIYDKSQHRGKKQNIPFLPAICMSEGPKVVTESFWQQHEVERATESEREV